MGGEGRGGEKAKGEGEGIGGGGELGELERGGGSWRWSVKEAKETYA